MANVTYERRKAHGECVRCGAPQVLPLLHCDTCRIERRPYSRHYGQTRAEALRLASGPNQVACCQGRFHRVEVLVLPNGRRLAQVACCGRMFSEQEEKDEGWQ